MTGRSANGPRRRLVEMDQKFRERVERAIKQGRETR
jgi:hypothetical protein